MARKFNLNTDITELSAQQLRSAWSQLARISNQRLTRLEQAGVTYYAYERAKTYLDKAHLQYFPTTPPESDAYLFNMAAEIQDFINSQTSTLSGINSLNRRRADAFRSQGFEVSNDALLGRFLASAQFKALSLLVPSEDIIEDFLIALDEGHSFDQILADYDEFINNTEMTFEQVREKRARRETLS